MQSFELKINKILVDELFEDIINNLVVITEAGLWDKAKQLGKKVLSGKPVSTKEAPSQQDTGEYELADESDDYKRIVKILEVMAQHYDKASGRIEAVLNNYKADPQKYQTKINVWLIKAAIPALKKRITDMKMEQDVALTLLRELVPWAKDLLSKKKASKAETTETPTLEAPKTAPSPEA